MTTFEPRGSEQRRVVESVDPLVVVLGGAGTGKTVCALAAARTHLERASTPRSDRVLFLSFSRAAVARVEERARGVLGPERARVDVSTFHALAFSVVRRFGSIVGHPAPVLVSPARQRLGAPPGCIGYDDLMPLALEIVSASLAVQGHLRSRWGLVIVDEFQDTGDLQHQLVQELASDGRRMLLGDPDQCIYTFLAASGVRYRRILEASQEAGADATITLPEVSHRDPTQVIPAVARAIQRRDFASEVLADAMAVGRLVVRAPVPLEQEVASVADEIRELRDEGMDVAVFTHHNDVLAALSDGLEADGIEHEIAGLTDALACALDAQSTMLQFAVGLAVWGSVLDGLAVFISSAQRGPVVPQLALDVVRGTGAATLQARLVDLRLALEGSTVGTALNVIDAAHEAIGLPSKSSAWKDASSLMATMHARIARRLRPGAAAQQIALALAGEAREATFTTLTDSVARPRGVQLMNLYQTKGREADATIVVLREGDNMGRAGEPWAEASRLLYVVFSRARSRIVVVPVGADLHPVVRPLARLRTG